MKLHEAFDEIGFGGRRIFLRYVVVGRYQTAEPVRYKTDNRDCSTLSFDADSLSDGWSPKHRTVIPYCSCFLSVPLGH